MELLYAHSFFMAFDDKQREVREPYPPLGTLIAAAQARREGHEVVLFDAMLADSTARFDEQLERHPCQAVIFFEDNFNWLSKMCLNRMRGACGEMIAMAKKRGLPVLVAGSDASDYPEVFLGMGADYVIKGEAEFRILDVLAHHLGNEGSFRAPGVFSLEGNRLRGRAPERGVRDLSQFPAAAWDLVDMESYRRIWLKNHGYFSLNMMTTRGCPYRCNWCAKPIHGRRYDSRDPLDAAREMHDLKTRYQPDHIWFTDDIFGLKPRWVERFAEEVRRLEAAIPFKIQARADLMQPESVEALRRAGCKTVWMGVESGSQSVLDAMDKDLRVEDIYRAGNLLQNAGIEVCFFLQFGYPGERVADIRRTWEMVADIRPDRIGISVAYPLPGTKFHAMVKDRISERDHWEHSHDMLPIHPAAYPAGLYPQLYDYFHQLFFQLNHPHRGGLRHIKDVWRHWLTRRRLKQFGVEGIPFS